MTFLSLFWSLLSSSVPSTKPLGFYNLLGNCAILLLHQYSQLYDTYNDLPIMNFFCFLSLYLSQPFAACSFYLKKAVSQHFSFPLYYPPQTFCYIPSGFPYCIVFTQPYSIKLPVKPVFFINVFMVSKHFQVLLIDSFLT